MLPRALRTLGRSLPTAGSRSSSALRSTSSGNAIVSMPVTASVAVPRHRRAFASLPIDERGPPNEESFTTHLEFEDSTRTMATYRVLRPDGGLWTGPHDVQLSPDQLVRIYKLMVQSHILDTILYDVQRQGRISFYMTAYGEEAAVFGSVAALHDGDVIYAQYRESGVLAYRGFTLDQYMAQCFSTSDDLGKGRQMPVHYGIRALNCVTISSPLATQIPQAAGTAYAQRVMKSKSLTACYFGDGAASEGDAHAGFNFAATLDCPVLFICRNNKYAISTPVRDQYRGDGIAARGHGYGIRTIRVDGNDIFAVYNATKAARDWAMAEKRPVLIECMTYRVGHHSTSDDSSRYRGADEIRKHSDDNPISRLKNYLVKEGLWDQDKEKEHQTTTRRDVLSALGRAEHAKKPAVSELFTDVYATKLPHLVQQERELHEHLAKYPQHYNLEEFAPSPAV